MLSTKQSVLDSQETEPASFIYVNLDHISELVSQLLCTYARTLINL